MPSHDPIVHDLEIMAAAKNYQRWMYAQFHPYVGRRIIECGAGIGNLTHLLANRELIIAVDSYAPCLEYLTRRFQDATNIIPIHMDISSPQLLDLARYNPDTIICVNVLEHVEDDAGTLSRMFTLLPSGGRLVLLVPAFQWLYGSIDQMLGHYRRDVKGELRNKVSLAGFAIHKLFYMNCVAVPGWFLNNRVFNRTEESPAQVLVFDRFIAPWLSRVERLIRPPFGLSLIAIGEKQRCDHG